MPTKPIQTAQAPKAIGPYSQAIEAPPGRTVYLSGQIALDPATGEMVKGDVVAQTERVMQSLKAVLEAAGATFDHVVKTTIYLADLGDFAKVNEVYGRSFRGAPPARATVQVAALPRGARVEIDGIAVV
jgi:2-iminobutanoate/2-iminopropanoate deaminase